MGSGSDFGRGWAKTGEHVLDQRGYLAGHDADRLADLNAGFPDPEIRAAITTRGGAGGLPHP
ncbi:LD-carboxypeptidase [Nonomuraea sp. B10E15]|uniref:LD-carboxypeptidase n=1 Tax=Nonomuraea sp. B10E15 TaxID=3153560 RepID=UPI00325F7CE5